MKTRSQIIIGIIILLAISMVAYASMQDKVESEVMMKETMMEKPEVESMMKDTMMEKPEDQTIMKDDSAMMEKKGVYVPYSPEVIANATGDIVLFFRAPWCPSCQTLEKDIQANLGKIPATLTLVDVDYDSSKDLKIKYGVTYQHTFVQVDNTGTLLKKWSGSGTLDALLAEIK